MSWLWIGVERVWQIPWSDGPSLQRRTVKFLCRCNFREVNFGIPYGFPKVGENIFDREELAGMCRVFNDEMHCVSY